MSNKDWYGCYDAGWKGECIDLAFTHPAKFSRALIRRIYAYMLEQDWLKPGDTVLDCFGGVALGSADALINGLNWVGVELEQKFVDLGAGCNCSGLSKEDWVRLFGRSPASVSRMNYENGRHWCPACLDQVNRVENETTLPRDYTSQKRRGRIQELQCSLGKRLGRRVVLAKPMPLPGTALAEQIEAERQINQLSLFGSVANASASYERNSGRIPETGRHRFDGNLSLFRQYARGRAWAVLLQGDSRKLGEVIRVWREREGSGERRAESATAAISSPPYIDSLSSESNGIDWGKVEPDYPGRQMHEGRIEMAQRHHNERRYSDGEDNLGGMPEGDFDGSISSPPYAGSNQNYEDGWQYIDRDKLGHNRRSRNRDASYGPNEDNLGNLPDADFAASIASPPFLGVSHGTDGSFGELSKRWQEDPDNAGKAGYRPNQINDYDRPSFADNYGQSSAQLGNLPEGEAPKVDGLIASPPFAGNSGGQGEASREGIDPALFDRHQGGMKRGTGVDSGNLDHLPNKDFEAAIGSPPYAGRTIHGGNGIDQNLLIGNKSGKNTQARAEGYGDQIGQLAKLPEGDPPNGLISSPPYAGARIDGAGDEGASGVRMADGSFPRGQEGWELRKGQGGRYGDREGQLAGMSDSGFDGAIGSPPFAESLDRQHVSQADRRAVADEMGIANSEHVSKIDAGASNGEYGATAGQLGAMKDGGFDGAISSSPFAGSVGSDDPQKRGGLYRDPKRAGDVNLTGSYGQTPGQLGGMIEGELGERGESGELEGLVSSPPYEGVLIRQTEPMIPRPESSEWLG